MATNRVLDDDSAPQGDRSTQIESPCEFCLPSEALDSDNYVQMFRGNAVASQGVRIKDFLLLADLVPIVPGHTLLIPAGHLHSLSALTTHQNAIAGTLENDVGRFLAAYFDQSGYISFEHGTSTQRIRTRYKIKCASTEHAHRHILPVHAIGNFASRLEERAAAFDARLIYLRPSDQQLAMRQLLDSGAAGYHQISYRHRGNSWTALYIPGDREDPSQLFRRLLTEEGLLPSMRQHARSDWHSALIYPSAAQRSDILNTAAALANFPTAN